VNFLKFWTFNILLEFLSLFLYVVEFLQGEHGLGAKKESACALKPPTNSEGFVVDKVWAITRIGLTSPVKKVTETRLDSLSLAEAKQEYSDVAGIDAAMQLATTHTTYNKGQGATKSTSTLQQ